jgi:hypothetical protein
MLRMRLASLLLASGLMLVCGCNCTGFCLSWHPQCGGHHCGAGGGCGSCCEPRTCCDIGMSRGPCCMPGGAMVSVPVADMMVQPGAPVPQPSGPRVVPVPQANPLPYQP